MQNKKGSILLISSWVLLILVILAVSLGHRSSIALRLCVYQRDSLKASYLAKAGINQAIQQLKEDASASPFYNSFKSIWSTGVDPLTSEPLFENVEIRDGSGEKFTVHYPYDDKKYLCMMDEERKININKAVADPISQPLGQLILTKLFYFAGVTDADGLKNLVIKWINPAINNKDEDPGQIFKNSDLETVQELLPILEFFYKDENSPSLKAKEIYEKIKDLITVYGDGRVNINTASEEILGILINSCIDECINNGAITVRPDSQNLVNLISTIRKDTPFENSGALSSVSVPNNLSSEEKNVLNKLTEIITFKSNNFRINSTGEITGKTISKTITCVFSRSPVNKIIYWHEN
ncbi:MAG: type II secretion system protein GspK [Candidatus Omnitrophica bacterium]|nr:type II secretion system protein GspK [Candidatus Omnitrophota bacterium]